MLPRNGGLTNLQISNAPDFTDRIDGSSCNRFAEHRPDELDHEPRSGQPPRTCRDKPGTVVRFPAGSTGSTRQQDKAGRHDSRRTRGLAREVLGSVYVLAQRESGYRIVQRSTHRG